MQSKVKLKNREVYVEIKYWLFLDLEDAKSEKFDVEKFAPLLEGYKAIQKHKKEISELICRFCKMASALETEQNPYFGDKKISFKDAQEVRMHLLKEAEKLDIASRNLPNVSKKFNLSTIGYFYDKNTVHSLSLNYLPTPILGVHPMLMLCNVVDFFALTFLSQSDQ